MKEANLKGLHTVQFLLHDILGKAKLWRQQKDQKLPGGRGKRGINRQSKEDLGGSITILYDTVIVDICHYTFVQTHRMYNTKSEPKY